MSGQLIGFNPAEVHLTQERSLGSIGWDQNGKGYEYVSFNATHAAGDFVLISATGVTSTLTVTSSGGALGGKIGVAPYAAVATNFGWVQRVGTYGPGANIAAGTVNSVRLNTTATAGRLDDDATSGAEQVSGVGLQTSSGTTVSLTWPTVSSTIA